MDRLIAELHKLRTAWRPKGLFKRYDPKEITKMVRATQREATIAVRQKPIDHKKHALLSKAISDQNYFFFWQKFLAYGVKQEGSWPMSCGNKIPRELEHELAVLESSLVEVLMECEFQTSKANTRGCDPRWASKHLWSNTLQECLKVLSHTLASFDRAQSFQARANLFDLACRQADSIELMIVDPSLAVYGPLSRSAFTAMDEFIQLACSDLELMKPVRGLLARCIFLSNQDKAKRNEQIDEKRHKELLATQRSHVNALNRQAEATEMLAEESRRKKTQDIYEFGHLFPTVTIRDR